MKIVKLDTNPSLYSSNVFLVLGDWNGLDAINTLVDVGSDGYFLNHLKKINTGVGKRAVERVIITHNHFDHTGGIPDLLREFDPEIMAHGQITARQKTLNDGEMLLLGDSYFEVIHTPGHSSDSICLFNKSQGILFSGDTQIRILTRDGSYTKEFVNSIKRLARLNIKAIYPGHGEPLTDNPNEILKHTLVNIQAGTIF